MLSTLLADNTLNAIMEADSQSSNPDSGSGTSTSVLERPEVDEDARLDDGGNADRFAHYVSKDRVEESRLTGRPVVALCGKVWIPRHEANDYPVCPECKRIYDEMGKLNFQQSALLVNATSKLLTNSAAKLLFANAQFIKRVLQLGLQDLHASNFAQPTAIGSKRKHNNPVHA